MAMKIILWFMTLLPLFCFLIWILVTEKQNPEYLVRIRQSLYTDMTEQISQFSKPPDQWQESVFPHDSPELIAKYKELTIGVVPEILNSEVLAQISTLESKMEQAKALILLFSYDSGKDCGAALNLIHNIKRLSTPGTGSGCCSDHSEVFLALASFAGLNAREVHSTAHTTVEVFEPATSRWVWLDPQFAIFALDEKSKQPLSGLEIRNAILAKQKPEFHCFGTSNLECAKTEITSLEPYKTEDYLVDFGITLGSNVFEQDSFNQTMSFIPSKSIRQITGLFTGTMPTYLFASDRDSRYISNLKNIRKGFITWVECGFVWSLLSFSTLMFLTRRSLKNQGV